jgi:hypothetical protein
MSPKQQNGEAKASQDNKFLQGVEIEELKVRFCA